MTVEHNGPAQRFGARTRLSGLWVALGAFALVLLFLLIFILQNDTSVKIWFFGAQWQLPLGVALTLAAVFGVLLVVIPAAARIVQLRIVERRNQRAADTARRDAEPAAAAPPPAVSPRPGERPADQQAWPQPSTEPPPPPNGEFPPAQLPQAPPPQPAAWNEPENRRT